ncbi:flavin-containing monooxygenase [Gordonia terrae]|uniref:NAD(P)/FAD-dependent oxidoreductase n=2 Tax=Gordonia terrae TaxID=2055 RepID=A0AAD0KAX4_9ACTN|nr:NAD(P)/FAD-dependent oxidoreductase [Gordonia terrae]VTR09535.1 FAD-containing monooxygenase EthA [Clostridioides difficile]ANY25817.1 FAD-containing monooxygenase EthA [Gordonia terrae]AWO86549.1 NAD(P)/FAD-dependent oxidoreductase [Gordonia terrae]VTS28691.1 FAD-containing monooxygenase EthA [Gordonia terrae]GAB46391.1 putative monooxygenase [Gordonia terrae NBRC 100016]
MTSSTKDASAIPQHVEVLVVGAGLTGIGMAYHLQTLQPGRTFAILESRESIGGTWDLFRYPGVRSDVDLYAFGYGFKPWDRENAIADASEILEYLQETVDENNLGAHIHFGHKVVSADFSTARAQWSVRVERVRDGHQFTMTCNFLSSAAGYYDVDEGYSPQFEGREDFSGDIVHPQHWPESFDYTGKKVVVIGSGATAVTLVPAMAEDAEHVTMLQRSPSYVLPAPRRDPLALFIRRLIPRTHAHRIIRTINVGKQTFLYRVSRRFPNTMRAVIRRVNIKALPEGFDVDAHFNPDYAPWDQRMCVVADGDLFKAIASGKAGVVTDRIARFSKNGILLQSGSEIEADIIVTATGLNMVPFGKIQLRVDGRDVNLHDHLIYKTAMVSDIPNFTFTLGSVNNAWTLKADLVAQWTCRLLAHMDRHGYTTVIPVVDDDTMTRRPYIEMGSGYVNRAMHLFPQQGSAEPWSVAQDYKIDRQVLGKDPIEESSLHFASAPLVAPAVAG